MNYVAFIMSVYAGDTIENLKDSVASIFDQSHSHWKLFLCVDGQVSNDVLFFCQMLSQNDKVLLINNETNKGLAYSLNRLIDLILNGNEFDFIARMDSDDICLPQRISSQLSYFSNNPNVDVCGSFCSEFGSSFALKIKKVPLLHNDLLDFSIYRCPFIHPTVMFRTRVFTTGIRYPTETHFTEDQLLWYILLQAGFKFGNVDEVLLKYRLNEFTIKRRAGLRKLVIEMKLRLYYMFVLRRTSFKNLSLLLARLIFQLMPVKVMKLLYAKAR